jgi:carboxyl-terminal processing protease
MRLRRVSLWAALLAVLMLVAAGRIPGFSGHHAVQSSSPATRSSSHGEAETSSEAPPLEKPAFPEDTPTSSDIDEPEPAASTDVSEVAETMGGSGAPTAAADLKKKLAQDPPQEVADKKAPEQSNEPLRDYSILLKNPQKLGFRPDESLFRNVYFNIRQAYVEPVTDDQLFKGVVEEVRTLLTQAKVPTDALDRLDKNRNVLHQLVNLYGSKVPKDVLVYAAIQGMLVGLDDPYSVLMGPDEYGKLQEQVQNKEFGGIGVYIELDRDAGNQLTVFEPIEGTPAAQAGVEPGDRILAIDGKSTKGISMDGAQAAIRGPVGTKVVLTIKRTGHPQTLKIPIIRGNIHVVSVTARMLPDKIGYVRLRQFGSLTASELETELTRLRSQGARALILDLRNNGGGYIDASVNVVGQFTAPGSLVVYTLNRNKERRDYNSNLRGGLDIPMVVMVNRYSASASEITAGALRDHKVAALVGEKTFGKGSVQQLYPFNNSALKLTIARFYSPAGHVIDNKGIVPEYAVAMEPRLVGKFEQDIQLQKAIRVIRSGKARP